MCEKHVETYREKNVGKRISAGAFDSLLTNILVLELIETIENFLFTKYVQVQLMVFFEVVSIKLYALGPTCLTALELVF